MSPFFASRDWLRDIDSEDFQQSADQIIGTVMPAIDAAKSQATDAIQSTAQAGAQAYQQAATSLPKFTIPSVSSLTAGWGDSTSQPSTATDQLDTTSTGVEAPTTSSQPAASPLSRFTIPNLTSLLSGWEAPKPPETVEFTPSAAEGPAPSGAATVIAMGMPTATPNGQPTAPVALPDRLDTSSRDANLRQWAPALQDTERRTGLRADALAAIIQAENGGGQSPLSANDQNYFSITAVPGRPNQAGVGQGGRFAHYNSPQDSLNDFVDLISTNPRYAEAWANRSDPQKFFQGLVKGGYIVPEPGFPVETWLQNLDTGRQHFNQLAPSPAPATPSNIPGPDLSPNGTPITAPTSQRSGGLDVGGIVTAYKDTSYTYGGPGGRTAGLGAPTDCSGFVSAVYQDQYGLSLVPHTDGAYNQLRQAGAAEVATKDARPGDVVFYLGAGTGGAITHHMGIYAGNGKVLDDSVSGQDGVHVRDVGHAGQYVILRDPRLNQQAPQTASVPPPIQPSGVAEATGGEKVSNRELQAQAQADQPTMYRQPLGMPTAGPDTTDVGSPAGPPVRDDYATAGSSVPAAVPSAQAIPQEDPTAIPRPAYIPPAMPLVTAPEPSPAPPPPSVSGPRFNPLAGQTQPPQPGELPPRNAPPPSAPLLSQPAPTPASSTAPYNPLANQPPAQPGELPARPGVVEPTPVSEVGAVGAYTRGNAPPPAVPDVVQAVNRGETVNPFHWANQVSEAANDQVVQSVGMDPSSLEGQAATFALSMVTNPSYWSGGAFQATAEAVAMASRPFLARALPAIAERFGAETAGRLSTWLATHGAEHVSSIAGTATAGAVTTPEDPGLGALTGGAIGALPGVGEGLGAAGRGLARGAGAVGSELRAGAERAATVEAERAGQAGSASAYGSLGVVPPAGEGPTIGRGGVPMEKPPVWTTSNTTVFDPEYPAPGLLESTGVPPTSPRRLTPDTPLYHLTSSDQLERIADSGLTPAVGDVRPAEVFLPDGSRATRRPGVYAADNAGILSTVDRDVYGQSVDWSLLRFIRGNRRWARDPEFADPGSWVTRNTIPPSDIEVFNGSEWVPVGAVRSQTGPTAIEPPGRSTATYGVFGVAPPEAGPAAEAVARPRFVPPDVRERTTPNVELPDDSRFQQAVENVGGQITDRGVELHVTRAQGESAAGQTATRGGVFVEPVREGGRSSYVTSADNPNAVGGAVVLPPTKTLYRKPLVVDEAPGSARGFDAAMRQLVPSSPEMESLVQRRVAAYEELQAARGTGKTGNINRAQAALDAINEQITTLHPTDAAIDAGIRAARAAGPEGSPARAAALKALVSRYGGDPALIDPLLRIRGADASESAWAIKENIVATNARKRGYDGVFTMEDTGEPNWKAINQHPLVMKADQDFKAANAALSEAGAAHQAAPTVANWRAYQQAEQTAQAAADAYKVAQTEAERLVGSAKLTEILDVQQGRNPTPGPENPRLAAAEVAQTKSLEEWDRLMEEMRPARQRAYARDPNVNGEDPNIWMRRQPELQPFLERHDAAYAETERTAREVHAARQEGRYLPGQPGYSLHPDVVPPSQGAAATAGITPVPVRQHTDVLASVNKALSQGVASAVSGGVGAATNQQLNPDDPNAAIKGFAVGAVAPFALSRGARALASRAGAEAGRTEGALAALGDVPGRGPRRGALPKGARPITSTEAQDVARLRLEKFPPELRGVIQDAAQATDFAHAQRRGVIPDAAAEGLADDISRSVDQWIKQGKAGKALNTEETRALRNVMTGQAQKVADLAQQVTEADSAGVATNLLIVKAHTEAEKLAGLVQYVEGARAEAGRSLRAWRAEPRPTDPNAAAQQIFKKFGTGPEARQRAIDALGEFQQIPKDDPIAMANFWARIERGNITSTDVLTAIRYNSMLSSPRTWEVGWIGSMLQAPFKAASDVLAATTRPTSGELPLAARGAVVGFQRGLRPLLETITQGITSEQAAGGALPRGLAPRATSALGRVVGTAIDLPGRMTAAPDALFSSIFREAELGRQAGIQAYRQGLKGEERSQFLLDFMTHPPKSADEQITRTVDRMMLRGDMGTFGNVVQSFGRNVPGGELYKSLILPFMKVAYHVWTQGVEMTPIGAAGTALDVGRGMLGRGPYAEGFGAEQAAGHVRPLAERLRYNAMGLGVTGFALGQAYAGNISAAGPSDPGQKAMLRSQGWQPYSVKVGGTWYGYSNWGPVSVPLASAGAIAENQQYRKPDATPEKDMLDMTARVGKLVGDQSFISGIGTLVNAYQEPDRYLPQFLANMATSFVPYGSALNVAGQATDPTQRRPERVADVGPIEFGKQAVEARLPGLRQNVPATQDVLGRPIPNDQTGASALEPFRFSNQRADPTIQAFTTAGVNIPAPHQQIVMSGAKLDLTPAEQRRWNEVRGEMLIRLAGPVAQSGALNRMPPVTRERMLQNYLSTAAQQADTRVFAEMPDRTQRLRDAISAKLRPAS